MESSEEKLFRHLSRMPWHELDELVLNIDNTYTGLEDSYDKQVNKLIETNGWTMDEYTTALYIHYDFKSL